MNNKGFTLIELLGALIVLALILLIAVPNILDMLGTSKNKAYEILKANASTAAETYLIECEINASITCNYTVDNNVKIVKVGELINTGFLKVSSNLVQEENGVKKLYNPINKKEISECLVVRISVDNNYKYTYKADDTACAAE